MQSDKLASANPSALSLGRGLLASLGLMLIASGVVVIRLSNAFVALLMQHDPSFAPTIDLFRVSDRFGLPALFIPGLVILGIGGAFLLPAARSCRREAVLGQDGPVTPPTVPLLRSGTMVIYALLQVALFAYLENRGALSSPWVTLVWIASLVFGVSVVRIWIDRRSDTPTAGPTIPWVPLACCMLFFLVLYAVGLNSWKFSFIGDEYTFYVFAEGLLQRSLREIPLLEASGSDQGFLPVAVSAYQALFMWIFGAGNGPWRLAMSCLIVACIPAVYIFFSNLLFELGSKNRLLPLLGTVVVFGSEFLIDWARIGKPLAPLHPPLLFAAAFYSLARLRRSMLCFALAGVSAGLGMYFTPLGPALALVIVCGWLALDHCADLWINRTWSWWRVNAFGFVAVGYLLTASPILVQRDYFQKMTERTVGSEEAQRNRDKTWTKTIRTVAAPLSINVSSHFLSGQVVDPFAAFLAVVGLSFALGLGSAWFLRGAWALGGLALMSAGISQYPDPPVTRIHVIMLAVGMLGTIGLLFLRAVWGRLGTVIGVLGCAIALTFNIVKLNYYNPYQRAEEYPHHLMREFQLAPTETRFLFISPKQRPAWKFKMIAGIYGYDDRICFFEDDADGQAQFESRLGIPGGPLVAYIHPDSESFDRLVDRARSAGASVRVGYPDGLIPKGECELHRLFPDLGC